MKRIITMLISLMLIFSLAACTNTEDSKPNETEPANLLEKIQKEGKMVIATEGTWAPYTM